MAKEQIIRLTDPDDGSTWIDYASDHDTVIDRNPVLTIVELADFCDQKAEYCNHESVVGVHRKLALLMYNVVGQDDTLAIMQSVAEYGGLGGMKYSGFGISSEEYKNWTLPDEVI